MKFRTKGFISLLLALSFLVVSVSGVVLYVTPRGRVANWTGWTMGGLDKHEWGAVHMNGCLLMLVVVAVHLFLNWRIFWSYIKKKAAGLNLKLEMAIALLATAVVVGGTVMQVPPLTATLALNDRIKELWEEKAPKGPAPHAEEFTVERFARSVGLSVDDVTTALGEEGVVVEDTGTTIGALAKQHGIVPSEVYSVITEHFPEAVITPISGRGRGQGMGLGMRGPGGGQGWAREQEFDTGQQTNEQPVETGEEVHGLGEGHGRGTGPSWGRGQGRGRGTWEQGQCSGSGPNGDLEP